MAEPALETSARADLDLTWLGAAGFRVRAGGEVFLIDPFLSRNSRARPIQDLTPGEISKGLQIFISHGHFDHLRDVSTIAANLKAPVFCHPTQARSLVRDGLSPDLIVEVERDGQHFDLNSFSAQATFSRHIKFDPALVLKTLLRINFRLAKLMPLAGNYPAGQVLSWRFDLPGRTIRHFGSMGSTQEELSELGREKTDVLLPALQGHSRICEIALDYVRALKPKTVIPHHQDDFYPPLSQLVDIKPFMEGMAQEFPETELIVPRINRPIPLAAQTDKEKR